MHHLTPALSPALPCGGEGEASAAFDNGVSLTRRPRWGHGKGTTSPRPSPPQCPAAEREKRRPPSIMGCHRPGGRAGDSEKAPPHPGPLPRSALRRRGGIVGQLRSWGVIESATTLETGKRVLPDGCLTAS